MKRNINTVPTKYKYTKGDPSKTFVNVIYKMNRIFYYFCSLQMGAILIGIVSFVYFILSSVLMIDGWAWYYLHEEYLENPFVPPTFLFTALGPTIRDIMIIIYLILSPALFLSAVLESRRHILAWLILNIIDFATDIVFHIRDLVIIFINASQDLSVTLDPMKILWKSVYYGLWTFSIIVICSYYIIL